MRDAVTRSRDRWVLIVALLVGCADDDHLGPCSSFREGAIAHCIPPDVVMDARPPCNPLTQEGCGVGEKCSWHLDALTPQNFGHVECVPNGTAMVGEACMFGAPGGTGVDNCVGGLVCSKDQGAGTCRELCDLTGGDPQCGIVGTCTAHASIFVTQGMSPTVGLCEML
jgi:hypothetical protein